MLKGCKFRIYPTKEQEEILLVYCKYYISMTCCRCGKIRTLTLKDRVFECSCGNVIDRDVNAAINIMTKAICSSL